MNKPIEITISEWKEIIQIPQIREAWGLTDESAEEFSSQVYGVKFDFMSGSPGYVGNLYILQGDVLSGSPPFVLVRDSERGQLRSAE